MSKVNVRIAVAVDTTGNWNSSGWKGANDDYSMIHASEPLQEGEQIYWLEAELDVPEPREPKTVVATVVKHEEEQ